MVLAYKYIISCDPKPGKIEGAILQMLPQGKQDLLNPILGSKWAFMVRQRPLWWHVAAHVHIIQADSAAAQFEQLEGGKNGDERRLAHDDFASGCGEMCVAFIFYVGNEDNGRSALVEGGGGGGLEKTSPL